MREKQLKSSSCTGVLDLDWNFVRYYSRSPFNEPRLVMEVLVSEPRLVMEGPLPEKMIFANAGSEPRVRNRRSGPWVREMSTFSGTGKLSHPRHTHLRVSCQEKGTSDTQRIDDAHTHTHTFTHTRRIKLLKCFHRRIIDFLFKHFRFIIHFYIFHIFFHSFHSNKTMNWWHTHTHTHT